MKLYTRRGDQGTTDLFGGRRVPKTDPRVEAYGTVDELNSFLGLAIAGAAGHPRLREILTGVQSRLFEIGADLATPPTTGPAAASAIPRIHAVQIEEIERMIDEVCLPLEPMRCFILPAGGELACRLHVARTVCRRAERICVALEQHEPIGDAIRIYLNRLSDLLFGMARLANQLEGVADVPWQSNQAGPTA